MIPVLEVGGTHVTGALVDSSFSVESDSVHRAPLDSLGSAPAILSALAGVADRLEVVPGARWGVAMPGPFDYSQGIGRFEGVGKFEALFGVDVRTELTARIDARPSAVVFLNDGDAFVLGEWAASDGVLHGTSRCAGFTLGTGIGSGYVVDGSPVDSGAGVPPGGRAHELMIDGRPLEDWVSRRAIRRAFAAATGDDRADVAEIVGLVRTSAPGDSRHAAEKVLADAFRILGRALGPGLARFGAERVVVGGSMAAAWDLLSLWFADGCVLADAPVPRVLVSPDPERAGLIGAAFYALTTEGRGTHEPSPRKYFGPVE